MQRRWKAGPGALGCVERRAGALGWGVSRRDGCRRAGGQVGLLHGRMKNAEKDEVMTAFRAKELDILVCTTVVEVGVDVPAGDVLDAVRAGAGELLEYARLVDDYRGSGVDEGQKSLTFALRFRATDRTLTAAEATEARDGAVRRAGERFGATLRD